MATQPIGREGPNVTPALRRLFTSFDREKLSFAITVAIDVLDVLDGDPDLDAGVEDDLRGFDGEEDQCPAGDDGCGPVYVHGSRRWGSHHEGEADFEAWEQPAT